MKIAVTGKGGVGKTTFAATLARLYAAEGRPVLAADVDPDANLGLALGFDEETLDSIVPISKLVEERTGATAGNQFYHLNPKVDDIPEKYGKVCNGVRLLVLGTVETGGGGCVCPEHVMLKRIINNMVLRREDVVMSQVKVVANKVRNEDDENFIRERIPQEDLLGMIHYNTEVIDADRQGKSPYDFSKTVTDEIIKIKEKIDRQ